MKFVMRLKAGERMTDLCEEFGISRKTGYKFWRRFEELSALGLYDQRRAPERIPHRTPIEIVERLLALKKQYSSWGAKKLREKLREKHPGVRVPATSTVNEILKRHNLVKPRRRRTTPAVVYSPLCHAVEPNDVWCIDFKGQFRLGDGTYCYPLTVTDAVSRYILVCEAFARIDGEQVRVALEDAFRRYGLPRAMRFDGGAPFASNAIAGLSTLSAWWMSLGIELERIEPASPQQNGRHERMHRTLKEDTTRPAARNLLQQQERFERFVEIFNHERPHEGLGMRRPHEIYRRSNRSFPSTLTSQDYPLHDTVVTVRACGHLYIPGSGRRKKRSTVFLSRALGGHRVGLRELDNGQVLVSFVQLDLGVIDLETLDFTPYNLEEVSRAAA